MRRIIDLEREGKIHPEILMKIISTLKLDKDIVNELIHKDKEEYEKAFEKWVNEPTSMYYTIRMMPTIYLSYDLPTNIKSEEEAIDYVSAVAREKRKLCWLNLSRKITVFINELVEVIGRIEAAPFELNLPYMGIK